MQGQAPSCPRCGAIVTNPGASNCVYCQSPLAVAPQQAPVAAGYGPPGYNQPQQPYPQQGYGPPPAYGAPPYGAAPYGAPNPYPPPYAQPGAYPGYGQGYPPVQQFGGGPIMRQPYYGGGSSWGNFWSVIWIIRIGVAVLVVGGVLMAACINAINN